MHTLAALLVIVLWLYMPYYWYGDAAFDLQALVQERGWKLAADGIVLGLLSVVILWNIPFLGRKM